MSDEHNPIGRDSPREDTMGATDEQTRQSRRRFLIGLGKWSQVVVVGAVTGGALLGGPTAQAGWINRRGGGGWINGGGGWINRAGGGWGGSWINAR
ncbi:hypothetical protein ABC977_10425 [Thioalkalicoccus limnaeus]|uniref:Uncharacterized protein n=1 Tax=Thioalkalicoccus limnaeus TaxID=120681 RepID=A0ABV4BHM4_9GAMM